MRTCKGVYRQFHTIKEHKEEDKGNTMQEISISELLSELGYFIVKSFE